MQLFLLSWTIRLYSLHALNILNDQQNKLCPYDGANIDIWFLKEIFFE